MAALSSSRFCSSADMGLDHRRPDGSNGPRRDSPSLRIIGRRGVADYNILPGEESVCRVRTGRKWHRYDAVMKAAMLAVMAGLCWGVGEFFTKQVLHTHRVGPVTAIAVRSTVALPVLWAAYFVFAYGRG